MGELGAQAPAGFWDPLGLSDGISPEQFDRYREVEQKHGRIAMIATIGYVVPEKIGTFGDLKLSFSEDVKFEDVPNGVQALFRIPTLGLLQILLLIGILETQFPNVNGDYGSRCLPSWACSRRTSSHKDNLSRSRQNSPRAPSSRSRFVRATHHQASPKHQVPSDSFL